jgi:hypothetical protein
MRSNLPTPPDDDALAGRLELRLDRDARRADALPLLARLLRRLRDRQRQADVPRAEPDLPSKANEK